MSERAPRILFSSGALYVYPLRAAFDVARAAGCDGLELDVCPEVMRCRPERIARLARETGVPVRAVHPPLFPFPGWRRDRDAIPRLVEIALALQAPTVVLHPPKAKGLGSRPVAEFVAALARARQRLRGSDTGIVLENPGFFRPGDEEYVLWHVPALRRFAEQCDLPIALDTAHAGSSPYPLLECYQTVRDRLAHVHLSDVANPRPHLDRSWLYSYVKHHQLPGEGHLPLAEFVGALIRDGYRGDIALELSPLRLEIWSLARARRRLVEAVDTTRQMLAAQDFFQLGTGD